MYILYNVDIYIYVNDVSYLYMCMYVWLFVCVLHVCVKIEVLFFQVSFILLTLCYDTERGRSI